MEQNKETSQENGRNKLDSDFITEKIKQRPLDKKKLLRRTLITAAMAVVFALVACLTFLILEPVLSNWLYPEDDPVPIQLPAETEEMLPEDMIADESEIAQPEPPAEIELQDEQIAQVLDNIRLSSEDYSAMYNGLADVAKEAAKSIVTVTGSVSNVDWFNNPYESEDTTSGIIVANQGKEIFILVNYEKLKDAETIMVTFRSGERAQAQLKKQDSNTKLAIISMAESDVEEETLQGIKPADLSGSSSNRAILGKPVIAVGSPMGTSDSVCYGVITSNNVVLNMIDSFYKVLTTDIYGSQNASGVLVNLDGQVLGIIDNTYNSEDMKNLVSAIGITELRRKIEKMSNEKDQAYLGTYGTDVTEEANEDLGVPYGAYITEIEMDSPAMNAGIQSGDIITAIGEKEIKTYGDLVTAMMELHPDQSVTISLMRQGPEEYLPMEVEVILGKLE
ncbi:S1C family serine protease [Kineothrix sp. MB12-C1]|uniref:S1C family serine protease n=1 Tax=Kineothrix sp. MB12-C1 TaxID=3070215 RepID=UPI0027D2EFC3|nr:PDZ domain-containing protein [Kineothrix sp. MB12-C1]WMC91370.1 PDZ domain-containing protein [Kineothrix sp. MB12-C1]